MSSGLLRRAPCNLEGHCTVVNNAHTVCFIFSRAVTFDDETNAHSFATVLQFHFTFFLIK